jgi:hypothetical protein
MNAKTSRISVARAVIDLEAASDAPAESLQFLLKRRIATLSFGVLSAEIREHPDAPDALRLLRIRRERPNGRAAEHCDEFAPSLTQ